MKQLFLLCLLITISSPAFSQTTTTITETTTISTDQVSRSRIQNIEFHILTGSKQTGFGFKYKSLYPIGEALLLGGGLGFKTYSSEGEHNFIPVTLESIGDLSIKGRTLFYKMGLGYGIALPEDESFADKARGGFMYDVGIGYRNKSLEAAPFISVSYQAQMASYTGLDDFGDTAKDVIYKRWNLAVGAFF